MTKGMSPLRLLVKNSPRKNSQEKSEEKTINASVMTPPRKALTPIPETVSNPLAPECLNNDAATPKGKTDATTPKRRAVGHALFPDTENVADRKEATITGTPGKLTQQLGTTPSRCRNILAGFSKKSPSVACPVQEAGHGDKHIEGVITPSRRRLAYGTEITQAGNLTKSFSKAGGEHVTPKSIRSGGTKASSETEVGTSSRSNSSQVVIGTPSSSKAARSLKYGASTGSVSVGSGLVQNRLGGASVLKRQLSMPQASQQVVEQHFDLEDDPHFWDEHNVQVLIRTRPINDTELSTQGFTRCLRQESPQTISWLGQPETRFTFDHVAGDIVNQEKLFQVAGLPMVENCMSGYNSCMFAYGQTGSGKTHTMLGDIDHLDKRPSEHRGMTPRVFEHLFERIRKEEEARTEEKLMFMCRCSFLEIYNEQITDLLEPSSTNLHMREDTRTGVYVENLSEVEVHNLQDVIQLLIQGASNRKVASTNMNRESSRSHSVFTCIVESKWERDSLTNIRFARLNLVDLAGSERQKSSGAEGDRLKEAANINKSLSTLGLVIMILVDVANGKHRHVPYRDSKLTFLLQDSLGGNSKTIIIATVSPASCNALETLSTLRFAQRAKLIRNTAVINEDASGDVKALRLQLQQMKEELDRIRRQSIASIPSALLPVDGSWDAARALGSPKVTNRQLRAMEAIVAGALRREQIVEEAVQRLTAEIEQLNRLVRQREEESQCSKMVLRFREEKIKRLESLTQGLLEVDNYLAEEKTMLLEELQLLRARIDRNPELTRFAMENIRLMDEIKSLKDFQEGNQEVMAQEITNLRDKLLELLEGKIAQDQGLIPLSTPQKKALAPDLAAKDRENDLLRIEADNYRCELEHCRSNLSSVLQSNTAMASQVDDLQARIQQLKGDVTVEQKDTDHVLKLNMLEMQQAEHLQLIADLNTQLEQHKLKAEMGARKSHELDLQLKQALQEAQHLQIKLQEATPNGEELEKRLRMEMEQVAIEQNQRMTDYEAVASLWQTKELDLRARLEEAQSVIDEISTREGTTQTELHVSKDETRRLELQLVAMEAAKNEECSLRNQLEETISGMREEHKLQLEEALSKLANEKAIIQAFESQQSLSMNELEMLQEEREKLLLRLKRREDKERVLRKKINQLEWELIKEQELRQVEREVEEGEILDEEDRNALELKLENAKKELDMARELNAKFQGEQDLQKVRQQDMDYSRLEAETETALAITSMQEELALMEDEVAAANQKEAAAREHVAQLIQELESWKRVLDSEREEIVDLRRKHEAMVQAKDAEIQSLQKSWEVASEKLIDYLADGDQALLDAMQEMEELVELSIPQRAHQTNKQKAIDFLHQQLQKAQEMARDTECKIRALGQTALEMVVSQGEINRDPTTTSRLLDEDDVLRLEQEVHTLKVAKVQLTAEKEFAESRTTECETMLLALQSDLAHAEMDLRQAQKKNMEMARAQEGLSVAKEEWDLERATLFNNISEIEQQYTAVQQALSSIQSQMMEAESREEVLTMELTDFCLAKEDWEIQKRNLETELENMRIDLERHSLEATKETSQNKERQQTQDQSHLTESRITALSLEIESLYSVNESLKEEKKKVSGEATELEKSLREKENALQATRDALALLKLDMQEAAEAKESQLFQGTQWAAEKEDLINECASLENRLNAANSDAQLAQEKVDALEFLADELTQAEVLWKSQKSDFILQIEILGTRLAEKEAECAGFRDDIECLEAALKIVRNEEANVTCELTALKERLKILESNGRVEMEEMERTLETNYVDIAKTHAALDSAEERVKILMEANLAASEDWGLERIRLQSENKELQLELSKLRHCSMDVSALRFLDENDPSEQIDHLMDEYTSNILEAERLHGKVRERDNTILLVRMELETAISSHKEAVIEMEKVLRAKEKDILRRQKEVDSYEIEITKLMTIVTETEERMVKSEADWRKEREVLVAERDNARMDAHQRGSEAATLARNFENNQATLREAEMMVDALVQAKDSAKSDAEGWKLENERLCRAHELATKNLYQETMDVLAITREEVDSTIDHCEKELGTLAEGVQKLREELTQGFHIPIAALQQEIESGFGACREDISEAQEKALQSVPLLTEKLRFAEETLQEYMAKVFQLQASLNSAEEAWHKSQPEVEAYKWAEKCGHKANEADNQVASNAELDSAQVAVARLQASIVHKDADLLDLQSILKECHANTAEIERSHQETVTGLQADLTQKVQELEGMKEEMAALHSAAANAEQENNLMRDQIDELRIKATGLEAELQVKASAVEALKEELLLAENKRDDMLQEAVNNLKEVESQRESLRSDLSALREELEFAKALVKEREAMTADACQVAQILKYHADRGQSDMISLGSSVSRIVNNLEEAQIIHEDKEKRVQELELDLAQAHRKRDELQSLCADKDAEIEDCKAKISNLMLAAEGQATEYHKKLKELESMVEQVKVEDRRLSLGQPTTPRTGEKSKSPFKGPGSPFKCIGKGMSQQMSSELDAELSVQQRRIEELEAAAASRQKEVFFLNTRLAEAESWTHDLIRDLLGVKLDISNFTESKQQVQKLAEDVRRRSITPEKATRNSVQEEEIENLKFQLNGFIDEREGWLEDLSRRHAEVVASRVSADKMRQRDQVLTAENEKLKLDNAGHVKRILELEKDIKKLSGQQNLQQRIHHHAKIKEENNKLRYQNEDLCTKLRRTEILFARVNDELAKYRIAEGKTPCLNIDEEQCLRSKLQEAEDAKIQMAQKLISLCTSIMEAAEFSPNAKEADHGSALAALEKLEDRLRSSEEELADMKFKSKMAGEKRRLSDLRAVHSPMKPFIISGPQNLSCPSPSPR